MRSFRFWLVAVLAALFGVGTFYIANWYLPGEQAGEPDLLNGAVTRLVLVETDGFSSSEATIRTLVRDTGNAPWQPDGQPTQARVGRAGLGWSHSQRQLAQGNEPIKQEGDKRAPAGLFRLGPSFGFGALDLSNYMQLDNSRQFCVDDLASEKYGQIVDQGEVEPGISGEKMWEIGLYRRGLVVDYPTDSAARTGSCIFIHVWKTPETPTVGCVAAAEDQVARLQEWVAKDRKGSAIAIVPKQARGRLGLNLPD